MLFKVVYFKCNALLPHFFFTLSRHANPPSFSKNVFIKLAFSIFNNASFDEKSFLLKCFFTSENSSLIPVAIDPISKILQRECHVVWIWGPLRLLITTMSQVDFSNNKLYIKRNYNCSIFFLFWYLTMFSENNSSTTILTKMYVNAVIRTPIPSSFINDSFSLP